MSLTTRLRSLGEMLAFRTVRRLCLMLGVDRASAISGWVWRIIAPRTKRHPRALRHLQAAMPELTETECRDILRRMWDNLGRTMAEGFFLEMIVTDPKRIQTTTVIEDAVRLAHIEGAVFIGGHTGNWELGAPLLWQRGLTVTGIYRHVNSPVIDAAVRQLREKFYKGGLWQRGGKAARAVLKAAELKHAIALLVDLRDSSGAIVPFFGKPAPSTTFPALLAREKNLPIFLSGTRRLKGVSFRIESYPINYPWTEDREADLIGVTALIHAALEQWIRDSPEQWMWAHRRWVDS